MIVDGSSGATSHACQYPVPAGSSIGWNWRGGGGGETSVEVEEKTLGAVPAGCIGGGRIAGGGGLGAEVEAEAEAETVGGASGMSAEGTVEALGSSNGGQAEPAGATASSWDASALVSASRSGQPVVPKADATIKAGYASRRAIPRGRGGRSLRRCDMGTHHTPGIEQRSHQPHERAGIQSASVAFLRDVGPSSRCPARTRPVPPRRLLARSVDGACRARCVKVDHPLR